MKKTTITVAISALLITCGATLALRYNETFVYPKYRETLILSLKDPDSAKYLHEKLSTDKNYYCAEINAKNSAGGYVGFRRIVVSHDGLVFADEESEPTIQHSPFEDASTINADGEKLALDLKIINIALRIETDEQKERIKQQISGKSVRELPPLPTKVALKKQATSDTFNNFWTSKCAT